MHGWLYVDEPYALVVFLVFTVTLGWLGGWATGRAFASTWRPAWLLVPAVLLLAAGVRFLHYAIGGEELTSPYYYLISLVVVAAGAAYGFQTFRAAQMARQYSWLFDQSGPFGWRLKNGP